MNQRPVQLTSPIHASGVVPADGTELDSVSQLLHQLDEARQARSEDRVRLLGDVENIRRRRQRDCVDLLQELAPHLHAAPTVERETDRQRARRFNIFRYLRDDELGLSQIIADLLDPIAEHGQGTTFLESMLDMLEVAPEASGSGRSHHVASGRRNRAATWRGLFSRLRSTATDKIQVVQERWLPGGRRIDITVDIPSDDGPFCLAFENKPYADDHHGQCRAYLEFLDREYGGRFLLIYLPPRYRMPDESSLPLADRERWKHHFRVLPYCRDDAPVGHDDPSDGDGTALVQADSGEDDVLANDGAMGHAATAARDDAAVGDGASLADWFGGCGTLCDAEPLRWFLREAQLFCQHHFGNSTMTDAEARHIREYLDENPKHLHAAFAVARAWPATMDSVCRRFLEHLRDRVKERVRNEFPNMADDLDVGCEYRGDGAHWNYLRVYRYGWARYEGGTRKSDSRTAVMLECGTRGPTSWRWGVYSPKSKNAMTEPEKERRKEVEGLLMQCGLSLPHAWWPHKEKPRYQDWSVIVPDLGQELADGGGRITDHYVNGLLNFAEKAIPIIDAVELENTGASEPVDS